MGMKPMFLPISESASGGVFLPGLAPEPASTAMMFPPGTYPIMASGDYVGTLFPLADPLPPPQMPYMPDSAQVAHSLGINPDSLSPLADPLPTSVSPDLPALPPMSVPFPDLPFLPPPQPEPITTVPQTEPALLDTAPLSRPLPTSRQPIQEPLPPDTTPLPDVRLPNPEPMRDIAIPNGNLNTAAPALPAPEGEVATIQGRPVLGDLTEVLKLLADRQATLAAHTEGRSRLRAGEPNPNLGNVVWQRQWGQP
jgi:hypothetical protein